MEIGGKGQTWVLLPTSDYPDASEVENLLGTIVFDYEWPLHGYIEIDEDDAFQVERKNKRQTEDSQFSTHLTSSLKRDAYLRLGTLLKGSFGKEITDTPSLKSIRVTTYALNQHPKIFNAFKSSQTRLDEIIEAIQKSSNRTLYFVVGIKTCQDAEVGVRKHLNQELTAQANLPVIEAIAGAAVIAPPLNLNIGGGLTQQGEKSETTDFTASGTRIFAIQYRLVKLKSEWTWHHKGAQVAEPRLGDLHRPGASMFGDGKGDDDEDDEEDDLDSAAPDGPELGRVEFYPAPVGKNAQENQQAVFTQF